MFMSLRSRLSDPSLFYENPRYIMFICMVINDALQLSLVTALYVVSYIFKKIHTCVCCILVSQYYITTVNTGCEQESHMNISSKVDLMSDFIHEDSESTQAMKCLALAHKKQQKSQKKQTTNRRKTSFPIFPNNLSLRQLFHFNMWHNNFNVYLRLHNSIYNWRFKFSMTVSIQLTAVYSPHK